MCSGNSGYSKLSGESELMKKGVVQSAESVLQSVLLHVNYAGSAGGRTEKKVVN